MYVVVHLDQSSEQVVVQAAHAAIEAGTHFVTLHEPTPSVVLLAVPDEATLLAYRHTVESTWGIRTRTFFEPDFAPLSRHETGHHTAFATEPLIGPRREAFADLKPLRFKKGVQR